MTKRGILEHGTQSGIGLRDLERRLRGRPLDQARPRYREIAAGGFRVPPATRMGRLRRELARRRGTTVRRLRSGLRPGVGFRRFRLLPCRWFRKEGHSSFD
jgi:hypothetical protein